MNGLDDSRCGLGRFKATEFHFRDMALAALFHEVFLKGQGARLGMHNRPNAFIAHGEHACFNIPLVSNGLGYLAESLPPAQRLGPKQVGCKIGITQAKPGSGIIAPERLKAAMSFLG